MKNTTLINNLDSKTIVLFLSLLVFCSEPSRAQSLYIPPACPADEAELLVQNPTGEDLNFWLAINKGEASDELNFNVGSRKKIAEKISDYTLSRYLKIYQSPESKLNFQLRCQKNESLLPLTRETSPLQEYRLAKVAAEIELTVTNLSWNQNQIQVFASQDFGHRTEVLNTNLAPRSTQVFHLPTNLKIQNIKLQAKFRILSTIHVDQKVLGPTHYSRLELQQPVVSNSAYFEMGLKNHSNSPRFIVRIDDPKLIETARQLIQHPEIEKIVFAQIERGHGDFNFDSQDRHLSPWSWHFSKVTNISDLGSTFCNGTPEMLEDHLDEWLQAGSYACFWSQRILRELP